MARRTKTVVREDAEPVLRAGDYARAGREVDAALAGLSGEAVVEFQVSTLRAWREHVRAELLAELGERAA